MFDYGQRQRLELDAREFKPLLRGEENDFLPRRTISERHWLRSEKIMLCAQGAEGENTQVEFDNREKLSETASVPIIYAVKRVSIFQLNSRFS